MFVCPGHLAWAARVAVTREAAEMFADHRAPTANMSTTGDSTVIKKCIMKWICTPTLENFLGWGK